jgi:hypothetical protein
VSAAREEIGATLSVPTVAILGLHYDGGTGARIGLYDDNGAAAAVARRRLIVDLRV